MADRTASVTLDELTSAIVAGLQAADGLDGLQTVAAYPSERRGVTLPAALVEVVELDKAEHDAGTGQLTLQVTIEVICIVDGLQVGHEAHARTLAAAVLLVAHLNRWGVAAGPGEVEGAFRDDFTPISEDSYAWRARWSQPITLGADGSSWAPIPGASPLREVYVGISPDVGPDHVDDYTLISEIGDE